MPPTRRTTSPLVSGSRVARAAGRTPERSNERNGFRQRLKQFLENKATAEALILRNDGDKKEGIPGLKDGLKTFVIANGERDEKGSFIYVLSEPIKVDASGITITKVKAEARKGDPVLNVERALALADKKGFRDKVEKLQYVLQLSSAEAELFNKWLAETGMNQRVTATDAVFSEDSLLQVHYGRNPDDGSPLLNGNKKPLISERELDSLYDDPETTYAFKPLQR